MFVVYPFKNLQVRIMREKTICQIINVSRALAGVRCPFFREDKKTFAFALINFLVSSVVLSSFH